MTASIEKYKFCEHVRAEHLNCLAQTRNENKAIWEEVKAIIGDLKNKLKWFEDSHTSLVAKVVEQETRIKGLTPLLRDSENDIRRARNKLWTKRNCRIRVEDNFNAALKNSVKKEVADALEQACLKAEAERGREKRRR